MILKKCYKYITAFINRYLGRREKIVMAMINFHQGDKNAKPGNLRGLSDFEAHFSKYGRLRIQR